MNNLAAQINQQYGLLIEFGDNTPQFPVDMGYAGSLDQVIPCQVTNGGVIQTGVICARHTINPLRQFAVPSVTVRFTNNINIGANIAVYIVGLKTASVIGPTVKVRCSLVDLWRLMKTYPTNPYSSK